MSINNSSQIATSTFGAGNAGSLNINADNITLSGGSETASGILATALEGTGNGGDINISTDNLSIEEGATIVLATSGLQGFVNELLDSEE